MRFSQISALALAGGIVIALSACSGSPSSASISPSLPNAGGAARAQSGVRLAVTNVTGVRVPLIARTPHRSTRAASPATTQLPRDAFVSDAGNASVDIIANQGWTNVGRVTNGLNGPDGDWVDRKGNLYVANYSGGDVTEYAPSATSPTFTYSRGLIDPINVSVDGRGNVYVSDFGFGRAGVVNVYPQGSNVVKAWCAVPGDVGGAEGVAIDTKGDVFVAYNDSGSGPGQIAEYVGGLKGCNSTILPVSLTFAGGIAIDASGNLIVCDQGSPSVPATIDVIAPPYTSITGHFGTTWRDPVHIALRQSGYILMVADVGSGIVSVRRYPSGAVITTLGSAQGIVQAIGVADFPEAAI